MAPNLHGTIHHWPPAPKFAYFRFSYIEKHSFSPNTKVIKLTQLESGAPVQETVARATELYNTNLASGKQSRVGAVPREEGLG